MSTDQHIVIEAVQLGPTATRPNRPVVWTYRVVTPPLPWDLAVTEWERLDARRNRFSGDNYLMVRSNDDPTWADLERPKVFKASKDHRSPGAKEACERAARAFAKIDPKGAVRGNSGGWLYREHDSKHPIGQGWDTYVRMCKQSGVIRYVPGSTDVRSPFNNKEILVDYGDWFIVPEFVSLPDRRVTV